MNQLYVKEIFQMGVQVVARELGDKDSSSFIHYFPIITKLKVEAILMLYPKKNMENEFNVSINYLKKMAELSCKWASEKREKDQVNKKYQISKIELTKLISTVSQPFCLVSRDGVIQDINEHLAAMIKKRRSNLIGEEVSQVLTYACWDTIKKQILKKEIALQLNHHKDNDILATIQPIQFENDIESYLILIKMKIKTNKEHKQRKLYKFEDIKGVSEVLQMTISAAKRVSKSDVTIMLRGESGTGKELFAQSIHNESDRKNKPFIAINCAAIPENLLESELFGYEKGAFTGAEKDKPGRFELANNGTIFLDEIGDMSLHLQAKILRIIQEKTIERIGSNQSKDIDVRIITATHQDLEYLVSEGKFREDLYYRISVIPISIPPLRNRREDLPLLIAHYMSEYSNEMKRLPKRLSEEVFHKLVQYYWPGNIRELQNVVRHFVELEIGDTVTLHSLPSAFSEDIGEPTLKGEIKSSRSTLKLDKNKVVHLLDRYGWNTEGKKKTASTLGISLATLYRYLKKFKL